MWSVARLTVYITTALAGAAVVLNMLGLAVYDAATGTVDLAPFSIYTVAPLIAAPLASVLAAIAVMLGWGGKKQ
jgi:hypothetical protein